MLIGLGAINTVILLLIESMGVLLVISVGTGFFNEIFPIFRVSPSPWENSFHLDYRFNPDLD